MFLNKIYPFTPLKNGAHKLWFPIFIGMSGVFGVSCGNQTTKALDDVNQLEAMVETSTPPVPLTPKSLTLDDIDFSSYSEDLAKFIQLENGEESWAAIDKMRLYFAPEDGQTILQTKTSTFS